MIKTLYIRPPKSSNTGIRSYSSIILEIMGRYCSTEFNFVDLSGENDFEKNVYTSFSRSKLREYLLKLKNVGVFKEVGLVIAEVGLNEYIEFFILMEFKVLFPDVPSFLTLHDPPKTVMNLNPSFSRYEKFLFARAIRRIYNKFFGVRVEQLFFRQNHNFIVLSRRGLQVLEERFKAIHISNSKIYYLPHVNCCEEMSANLVASNLQTSVVTFGYLGFLNPHKGIDLIVEALEQLGSQYTAKVIIAGGVRLNSDKRYLDKLKNLIIKKGLGQIFEFTGYLENDEIFEFLRNIDVMILPYRKTDSGSASGPFMWARSLGIPVIASNTRSFPENITHGKDGMLFNADDTYSLRKCIQSILENDELLSSLKKGASMRKEECSYTSTAFKVKELLEKSVQMPTRQCK